MTSQPAAENTNEHLIISKVDSNIGFLTLNRDKALNSLNHEMIHLLHETLKTWSTDPDVHAVVLQGKGRAFCAGGDVRNFYYNKIEGRPQDAVQFFEDEYALNALIKHYHKPYISLINGINMGGGMGVSVHGSHRVITENALISMPETTIGFFPDVGGTYFLSRMDKKIGLYLGLTGDHIKPEDAMYAGIGTHFCLSKSLDSIVNDLKSSDLAHDPHAQVDQVLERHASPPPESSLKTHSPLIESCFTAKSVEDILSNLEKEGSEFAQKTQATLSTKSPTSLKVVVHALNLTKDMDFDACMQQELNMTTAFAKAHDFAEGVRALLIDKDKNPQWQPQSLKDVTPEDVNSYF